MAGINRAILIGNVGKQPEVRTINSDTKVCNFPIATSETYKDKAGVKQETTEWHNIVLWRGLAEVAEKYLKKGMTVYIEGKIKTRMWEKEGVKRYTTEIVGDNFQILSKKESAQPTGEQEPRHIPDNSTDDLPF